MMRKQCSVLSFAALAVALGLAAPLPARAGSACTGFVVYTGPLDACHELVRQRTLGTQYEGKRAGQTYFYWLGNNAISARCLPEKYLALAAFHESNDGACPMMEGLRKVLAEQQAQPQQPQPQPQPQEPQQPVPPSDSSQKPQDMPR